MKLIYKVFLECTLLVFFSVYLFHKHPKILPNHSNYCKGKRLGVAEGHPAKNNCRIVWRNPCRKCSYFSKSFSNANWRSFELDWLFLASRLIGFWLLSFLGVYGHFRVCNVGFERNSNRLSILKSDQLLSKNTT